jgi:hypothetical protein
VILRCAITQEQIAKDRHNCYDCPGAEAITAALRAAGLEELLPVTVDSIGVEFGAARPWGVPTPSALLAWIRAYDGFLFGAGPSAPGDSGSLGQVEPIEFDLKLPDEIVAACREGA